MITDYEAHSPLVEAYRAVRTNLQFASVGEPIKFISFTSATPSEGKSMTVANLAITMAQDGKRVLLIDADMRKPVIHRRFGLPNKGLSNYIAMGVSLQNLVEQDVVPNLDVLSSGPVPPNPSELLGSARMKQLMEEVADVYDYIFIDMPPILAVTDAAILASKVDRVVFVVMSGADSPEELKLAKTNLVQAGANIMGVILNAVPQKHHAGYYYYYYDADGNKTKKKK